jgi:putative proteasome-type protease
MTYCVAAMTHRGGNLSVGLPVDLVVYDEDALRVTLCKRCAEGDTDYSEIRRFWPKGLQRVFAGARDMPWE